MMKKIMMIAMFLILGLSVIAWAMTAEPTNTALSVSATQVAQASTGTKADSANQEKKDYLEKARNEFGQLDVRLEQLRVKLGRAAKKTQEELYDLSYSLESKRAVAMQKIQSLEQEASEKWKDMKSGVRDALDDLKKGVDDLQSKLK